MRIRVPCRLIALGFLLALLCLLPSVTPVAHARPIGWDMWGDKPGDAPDPDPTPGDNDGGVLARSFSRPTALDGTAASTTVVTGGKSIRIWTDARTVYRYAGIRGILAVMRLDSWLLGPR
jgi:hypothetical protein